MTLIMMKGYRKDSRGGMALFKKMNNNVAPFPDLLTVCKGTNILAWRMESISVWMGWTSSTIRAPVSEPKMNRPTVRANARSRNLI